MRAQERHRGAPLRRRQALELGVDRERAALGAGRTDGGVSPWTVVTAASRASPAPPARPRRSRRRPPPTTPPTPRTALLEVEARRPPGGQRPARIDDHRRHLAGLGRAVTDGQLGAGDRAHGIDHLEHRQRPPRADHHRALPVLARDREPDRGDHVADVDVIADLAPVAVDLERPPSRIARIRRATMLSFACMPGPYTFVSRSAAHRSP